MRALVVEHAEHEGPGLVGAALQGGGVRVELVRRWAGDALPSRDGAGYDLVLVLGGAMSANEPWLDDEAALLASSARYAHQAYRVGARGFGVQFHPECDRATRIDWATRDGRDPGPLAG